MAFLLLGLIQVLDIELIRENPDHVKDGLLKVGEDPVVIERVRELDAQWRMTIAQSEELKAERNRQSREIAGMAEGPERGALIARMRHVGDRIRELDARAAPLFPRFA